MEDLALDKSSGFVVIIIIKVHYRPEATPTKIKSTGRSESCSDMTLTSPVTKKNFKIGPLGDFEKIAFFYFSPSPTY